MVLSECPVCPGAKQEHKHNAINTLPCMSLRLHHISCQPPPWHESEHQHLGLQWCAAARVALAPCRAGTWMNTVPSGKTMTGSKDATAVSSPPKHIHLTPYWSPADLALCVQVYPTFSIHTDHPQHTAVQPKSTPPGWCGIPEIKTTDG